ncbi:MAG: phosphate signaling complex protein PhoU [Sporomusaceae bacterium]|nr:phosphate signaling complex protein PhoU [Sporomusaceae bacterium]
MHDSGFNWLHQAVLKMGGKTIEAVEKATDALVREDTDLAAAARSLEKSVDAMYVIINERCLDLLSSRERNRTEVNFLASSLKIAVELERICDYANQIAKLVQRKISLQATEATDSLTEVVGKMRRETLYMLKGAIAAYQALDAEAAVKIDANDCVVDQCNRQVFRDIVCILSVHPWAQELVLDYHIAVRYIERMADRATNIAELVYYIVNGQSFRDKTLPEGLFDD